MITTYFRLWCVQHVTFERTSRETRMNHFGFMPHTRYFNHMTIVITVNHSTHHTPHAVFMYSISNAGDWTCF